MKLLILTALVVFAAADGLAGKPLRVFAAAGAAPALEPDSDWKRAVLMATANAVFAEAGLIDRTVHCRNRGPAECAGFLSEITTDEKVALFGQQPRFLEKLHQLSEVRCVDIDPELIDWADRILVTGSATVNDTFDRFLDTGKPLHVFGTTGAAAGFALGLTRYCHADTVSAHQPIPRRHTPCGIVRTMN